MRRACFLLAGATGRRGWGVWSGPLVGGVCWIRFLCRSSRSCNFRVWLRCGDHSRRCVEAYLGDYCCTAVGPYLRGIGVLPRWWYILRCCFLAPPQPVVVLAGLCIFVRYVEQRTFGKNHRAGTRAIVVVEQGAAVACVGRHMAVMGRRTGWMCSCTTKISRVFTHRLSPPPSSFPNNPSSLE